MAARPCDAAEEPDDEPWPAAPLEPEPPAEPPPELPAALRADAGLCTDGVPEADALVTRWTELPADGGDGVDGEWTEGAVT